MVLAIFLHVLFSCCTNFSLRNVGNFTHKHKYPCSGCQDGYFTEYLTTHRGWKYVKLPVGTSSLTT